MFEPGTVTYGFAKNISNPKNKYAISIFRDEHVQVLIHFTTSQPRTGIPDDQFCHGINRDSENNVVAYVFEPTVEIGDTPDGDRFHFPTRTIMLFDYGFLQGDDWHLQQQFDNLEIKCKLDQKEYEDLIYAMYCNKRTPENINRIKKKFLLKYVSDIADIMNHAYKRVAHFFTFYCQFLPYLPVSYSVRCTHNWFNDSFFLLNKVYASLTALSLLRKMSL